MTRAAETAQKVKGNMESDLMQWWLRYLPTELRAAEPERPEGTDLVIWRDDGGSKPHAIAFQGKARKPVWNYAFRDTAHREQFIAEKIAGRKAHFARNAKRADERKAVVHSFALGDILSSSWGYDQTNVDFYKVVEVKSAKTIVICKIGKVAVADQSVMPAPGTFDGTPMLKRVTAHGNVKIESFAWASKWSGEAKYETDIRAGH